MGVIKIKEWECLLIEKVKCGVSGDQRGPLKVLARSQYVLLQRILRYHLRLKLMFFLSVFKCACLLVYKLMQHDIRRIHSYLRAVVFILRVAHSRSVQVPSRKILLYTVGLWNGIFILASRPPVESRVRVQNESAVSNSPLLFLGPLQNSWRVACRIRKQLRAWWIYIM